MADRSSGRPLSGRGGEAAAFLRSIFNAPKRTGAISPSGRRLAKAMAAQVDPAVDGPVYELGPGTGVVTAALIERGIAPERLVLFEFNSDFCALLARRFQEARVIEGDAFAITEGTAAIGIASPAAVVSGLPLLNFPPGRRAALIERCLLLSPPGMPFVQFSYGVGPPVDPAAGIGVDHVRRIWLNIPPAAVWVYRRTA